MNKNIVKRVLLVTDYIINTGATIRDTASKFNLSKSTVHKDIQERLLLIDKNRYCKIKVIMKNHLEIRHINGGESTRRLFLKKREVIL